MGFPENMDALLRQSSTTQEELASIAGVTPGAVSGWKKGSLPRKGALRKICEHFNLPEESLLSDRLGLANANSQNLLALGGPARANFLQQGQEPPASNNSVLQRMSERYPGAFSMTVQSDAMSKVLPIGVHAVVKPEPDYPKNGSIAVVRIKDFDLLRIRMFEGKTQTVIMRRWYMGANHLMLCPESYDPDYEDIVIDKEAANEALKVLGSVVWYRPSELALSGGVQTS